MVRCTALKLGTFSSSCSKLCNEWSLIVCTSSRSRVTLVQTKSGEHWDDVGEHCDGSHSGRSRPRNGDSVSYFHRRFSLPVSAWAALQIQALRVSWDPSSTATSASWVHGPSKTILLPSFLSTVRYNAGSNNTVADSAATGDATPEGTVRCEILENSDTWASVPLQPKSFFKTLRSTARNSETFAVFSWPARPGRGAQPDWSFLLSVKKS